MPKNRFFRFFRIYSPPGFGYNGGEITRRGEGRSLADFYDMVTPPEQRGKRSREKAVILAVLTLLVVLAAGFTILRLAGYKTRVREFHMALNRSTIYAYNNDCLRAELDGTAVHVSGDHAYDVYQFMCVRSLGVNALFVPGGAAVTLSYGDGAVLELWPDRTERGMFLRFTDAEGRVCRFHSRDMRLNDLCRRYLTLSKNAPWE